MDWSAQMNLDVFKFIIDHKETLSELPCKEAFILSFSFYLLSKSRPFKLKLFSIEIMSFSRINRRKTKIKNEKDDSS